MPTKRQPNSVLVASGSAKMIELISEILPKASFAPITTVTSAGEAKRLMVSSTFDVVIINTPLPDEFGTELALDITTNKYSGVLLIVKTDLFEQVAYKVEEYGVLTIVKPNSKQGFYQAVKLLTATKNRIKKSEKKNETLQAKMDEIRLVNRAKWILIDRMNLNEAGAHRYIEKQAMDMRTTRREIALNILRTYES